MSPIRSTIRLSSWLTATALTTLANAPATLAAQRTTPASATAPASLVDGPELNALKNLRWRSIGPANQAGRIPVVMGLPGDRNTYYIGAAAGGLLKTTNGGVTFTQIFDEQPVSSIGDLQIAPTDPNTIYVGTGENNPRNSASIGAGVYKSIDAGKTWRYVGLDGTDKIARLRIDPRDPNVVYVCALGHTWGPNVERGVFKTTDGGKSWNKILYKNELTGCSDLDIDPTNSNIVYAGMYTHQRYPWYFTSGAGETALYKSIDGGATWTKLSGAGNTRGLPKGDMDRIGISVHRANPDVVYMLTETKDEGMLWRTDDAGETWRVVNRDPNINFRPFYYSDVRVDPRNPNRVFTLSGRLYLSEDGGRNFQTIARDVHGDHQALWIDPVDPNYLINGSDGGWQLSYDGGRNFEIVNTYAFSQFYHINLDNQKPYNICGGLQDNGHWCGPSRTLLSQGNRKRDWVTVSGGDGFHAVPDLERPWLVYTASQGGNITLTDTRTGDTRSIHPYPNRVGSAGDSLATHKFRFNWNSPIVLDPKDSKTVYFGGNVIFKTTNFGQSWDQISPDLTTDDKRKQMNSGGPIVRDNTAAEFHSTLLTIAPSPKNNQVIWAGSDDGNVQVTQDGGKTWTNVARNLPGLAPNAWISTIHASDHDAGTAYVAASHWQTNDYAPYAYVTRDYGRTWKRITSNLPARGWVHVVRDDPKNANLLYLGTEFGPYVSFSGGERWYSLRLGIGATPVRDLLVHSRDNELVIGTHGRGLFILDDLAPLQQLAQAMASNVYVFDVKPTARYVIWGNDANLGQKHYQGENPPYGALIYYYSKNAGDTLRASIADATGKQVRQLQAAVAQAGVNRIVWDLRHDAPRPVTPVGGAPAGGFGGGGGGGGFFGGGGGGPSVVPGTYTVTLSLGGVEVKKAITVEGDPRTEIAAADLQQQLEAALALRDLASQVNATVDRSNDLIRQLTNLTETLRRAAGTNGDQSLRAALTEAEAALKEVRTLRDEKLVRPVQGLGYRQYPRLQNEVLSLFGSVARSYNRPTDPQQLRRRELVDETNAVNGELQAIVNGRIAKLNELLKNTPHVLVGGRTIM